MKNIKQILLIVVATLSLASISFANESTLSTTESTSVQSATLEEPVLLWSTGFKWAKGESPVSSANYYPFDVIKLPNNLGEIKPSFGFGYTTTGNVPVLSGDITWTKSWMISKQNGLFFYGGGYLSGFYQQNGPLSLDNFSGRAGLTLGLGISQ